MKYQYPSFGCEIPTHPTSFGKGQSTRDNINTPKNDRTRTNMTNNFEVNVHYFLILNGRTGSLSNNLIRA